MNDLENKVSPKDMRDYTNAQSALKNIEMQELQGMIVDSKKAEAIKAVHRKTMERIEQKAEEKKQRKEPKAGNPLAGKPPGRYKVNGEIVSWDGTKEL
jgi:GTP cyclohydrolase II